MLYAILRLFSLHAVIPQHMFLRLIMLLPLMMLIVVLMEVLCALVLELIVPSRQSKLEIHAILVSLTKSIHCCIFVLHLHLLRLS